MTDDPFSSGGSSDDDREAASFLSGGGTVAAKFPDIGATFEGTIVDWEMRQQTDKDTGDLKWFVGNKLLKDSEIKPEQRRAAKPANQLLLHCQGEATGITHEWVGRKFVEKPLPDDDGMRTLFVKSDLQRAVSRAIKESGGRLERGAYVQVKLVRTEKVKGGDFYKNVFAAKWTPAAQNPKATADFMAAGDADDASTSTQPDAWSEPAAPKAAAPAAAAPASDPWA
jgi:hypothetical protein